MFLFFFCWLLWCCVVFCFCLCCCCISLGPRSGLISAIGGGSASLERLDVGGVGAGPAPEHRRSGHQGGGSGRDAGLGGFGVHPAVDLQHHLAAAVVDHAAHPFDLAQLGRDE